jgi:hypothetical protein
MRSLLISYLENYDLVIDSHTRGLFRPSRVNIHVASVLGRCDRPKLGYVGGWTDGRRGIASSLNLQHGQKKVVDMPSLLGFGFSKWRSEELYCAKLNILTQCV